MATNAELKARQAAAVAQGVATKAIYAARAEDAELGAPPEFLRSLSEIADKHGILLIADEIQSGIARTGRMFGIEHSGVAPDLVITAKGLGGGFPTSAVTGRAEVMDAAHPGGLGGTYGGNPISVDTANAVLGAGVVGVATTYYLARDGHEVVLIDRRAKAAAEASFGNGGLVSPSDSYAWASPDALRMAVKSLYRSDLGIKYKLRVDPALDLVVAVPGPVHQRRLAATP